MSKENQPRSSILKKVFNYTGTVVNAVEIFSLIFCVGSLAALLIVNLIARNFFKSIYFTEEISEFLMIFITFAGMSYAVRKARHIRMGAILETLPDRVQKVLIILISAISAVVLFYLSYKSYEYLLNSMQKEHATPALRLPYWIFYVIVPIGFFMAGLQYIRTILKNFSEPETWISPEQQNEYEEEETGGMQV